MHSDLIFSPGLEYCNPAIGSALWVRIVPARTWPREQYGRSRCGAPRRVQSRELWVSASMSTISSLKSPMARRLPRTMSSQLVRQTHTCRSACAALPAHAMLPFVSHSSSAAVSLCESRHCAISPASALATTRRLPCQAEQHLTPARSMHRRQDHCSGRARAQHNTAEAALATDSTPAELCHDGDAAAAAEEGCIATGRLGASTLLSSAE